MSETASAPTTKILGRNLKLLLGPFELLSVPLIGGAHMNRLKKSISSSFNRPRLHPSASDGFHDVECAPGIKVRAADFNVKSQPVSFHHALHWFLSYLLAYVPKVLDGRGESRIDVGKGIWDVLFAFEDGSISDDVSMRDAKKHRLQR